MISRKIDLTENRDFQGGRQRVLRVHIRQFLDGIADIDDPLMDETEYEFLSWYEGIFGRQRHMNQKAKVFNYEKRFEEMWKGLCVRCGHRLVPWKSARSELCHKCDVEMDSGRVPWKDYYGQRERSIEDRLFNLR